MGLSHTPYVDRMGLFVVWEFCIYMIVLITPIRRMGVFTYAVWGFSHTAYVGRMVFFPEHSFFGCSNVLPSFFSEKKILPIKRSGPRKNNYFVME